MDEAAPSRRASRLATFEFDRAAWPVETCDEARNDLRALAQRNESRIATLSEQLGRSQADLESTSARYTELAGEIPADLAGLGGQLCRILNAASDEADAIVAEARRHADTVRFESEESAARVLAKAQLEHDAATALRAEVEAQSKQKRTDIARLQEQAVLNATDILKEANDTAEEMLGRVHRDIDAQLALAQMKLDELVQVRANIAAQLRNFYDNVNQLDSSVDPAHPVRAVSLVSDSSPLNNAPGAHAAPDVVLTRATLRNIG